MHVPTEMSGIEAGDESYYGYGPDYNYAGSADVSMADGVNYQDSHAQPPQQQQQPDDSLGAQATELIREQLNAMRQQLMTLSPLNKRRPSSGASFFPSADDAANISGIGEGEGKFGDINSSTPMLSQTAPAALGGTATPALPVGVLAASEDAIRRMFRNTQENVQQLGNVPSSSSSSSAAAGQSYRTPAPYQVASSGDMRGITPESLYLTPAVGGDYSLPPPPPSSTGTRHNVTFSLPPEDDFSVSRRSDRDHRGAMDLSISRSSISARSSGLDESSLDGIVDGGYHEGYWRTKYKSVSVVRMR
jgi:hypothetical protein